MPSQAGVHVVVLQFPKSVNKHVVVIKNRKGAKIIPMKSGRVLTLYAFKLALSNSIAMTGLTGIRHD